MTKRTKKSVIKDVPIGGRLVEVHTNKGTTHRLAPLPPKPSIETPSPVGKRRRVETLHYEQEHWSSDNSNLQNPFTIFNPDEAVVENSNYDYMLQWEPRINVYLKHLYSTNTQEDDLCCAACGEEDALWRGIHAAKHPFHRVEMWTGEFYEPSWLWKLGVCIFLGHRGKPCPLVPYQPPETHPNEQYLASAKSDWNNYGDFSFGSSPQYGKDGSGQEIVVVHVNGVHRLVAYPCICPGVVPLDEQYLMAGLYPSTFKSVETVFTFELLRDYNLAVLECCTSAGEYFSKLRRLTNPDFPDAVPNRHRELLRAARQFRHLQELMRFGFTTREAASMQGSMAMFCAACPQPDVNLEDNWENDKQQWKYSMSFVADGNFVCVRQSNKGAGQDLFLKQGQGFFVESRAYKHHLASATENAEPSTCNEHRAVADKNKAHKGYDATGIGALACARHGAFVPSSVVDFQKGERQMNMDYALCEGLKTVVSTKVKRIIFIYDICCQYWKNLAARIRGYGNLQLPWYDRMVFSIGQFHVHGHQEKCLPRFSPLYIDGIGWNHGEILEPNWSVLNPTGTMTSTMTEAHRMEVLDSKIMDLNWKKMTKLYKSLPKLLEKAFENLTELEEAVEMLKTSASQSQREMWDNQLAEAQKKRERHNPDAMDILLSTIDKAPSRKAIEASLITAELRQSRHVGLTSWIHDGMLIQELQMEVLSAAKELGSTPTDDRRLELEKKRAALKSKHDHHLENAVLLFPHLSHPGNDTDPRSTFLPAPIREPCDCVGAPCGHTGMDVNPFEEFAKGPLEKLAVLMPSSEPAGAHIFPQAAKDAELELRKAQADEALANLRTQVGYKSFLFKANIQLAQNKAQKTRGYAAVASAEKAIQRNTRVYNQAQWAIWQLSADSSIRDTYRKLQKGDAKPLESIYQPNAPGQSRQNVSWIWGWKHSGQSTNPEFLLEICRLNWLRTTSRLKRWQEEVDLSRAEMRWTVRYMENQANHWDALGMRSNEGGARASAKYQAATWRKLAFQAAAAFSPFWDPPL